MLTNNVLHAGFTQTAELALQSIVQMIKTTTDHKTFTIKKSTGFRLAENDEINIANPSWATPAELNTVISVND